MKDWAIIVSLVLAFLTAVGVGLALLKLYTKQSERIAKIEEGCERDHSWIKDMDSTVETHTTQIAQITQLLSVIEERVANHLVEHR